MFKGKEIPCLVRWTTKGGINGAVLVEILQTLDELGVYSTEHTEGETPFLMIDGHGSRLKLPFLKHINENTQAMNGFAVSEYLMVPAFDRLEILQSRMDVIKWPAHHSKVN